MFCSRCGANLPDGMKFCGQCGSPVSGGENITMTVATAAPRTAFVPAQCTNCNGKLEVNPEQDAAICPYCGSAFIVEKAVHNYNISVSNNVNIGSATINIQGHNSENLLARAKAFEAEKKYDSAKQYYNQVLDCDIKNQEAIAGVKRVEHLMKNYVFYQVEQPRLFSSNEIIKAKADRLELCNQNGGVKKNYFYINMKNLAIDGLVLWFNYAGELQRTKIFTSPYSQDIINLVLNAQAGKPPKFG